MAGLVMSGEVRMLRDDLGDGAGTPTLNPADELRQAAETLRERAERATAHPWVYPPQPLGKTHNIYGASAPLGRGGGLPHGMPLAERVFGRDARYIATMHPGVGLALADWLDNTARAWRFSQETPPGAVKALAVARLVNGGAS